MHPRIDLIDDEEIHFEDRQIVLTDKRLIGNFGSSKEGEFSTAELNDIGPPNKFNGGRRSKRQLGTMLAVGGGGLVIIDTLIQATIGIPVRLEAVVFIVGALGLTVGLYLLLNSLFRNKPNTTVIFPVIKGEDIAASYPEWDNPEAERLVRQFARAKRGIGRRRSE